MEPEDNSYDNPIQYTNNPLLSGYISEEQLELLKGSVPFKNKTLWTWKDFTDDRQHEL